MKEHSRRFSLYIGHTLAAGRIISLEARGMRVEISSPYRGIQADAPGIPPHADRRVRYIDSAGCITPRGWETAERLLLEIYRGCRLFETRREELQRLYNDLWQQETAAGKDAKDTDVQERIDYELFLGLVQVRHVKLSFSIVRQLIEKFLDVSP